MGPEKRRFSRTRHRVGCEFELAGRRHTGFVGDLSARGIFVQCAALPPEEGELELMLRAAAAGDEIRVRGRVARRAQPNRTAFAVARPGFGLEITWAAESYYALLVKLGRA